MWFFFSETGSQRPCIVKIRLKETSGGSGWIFFAIKRSPNFSEGSGFNLFSEEMAKINHGKSNEI